MSEMAIIAPLTPVRKSSPEVRISIMLYMATEAPILRVQLQEEMV
jgi:hypothetical protein